ncbi:MAG TPA: hypothetical protein VGB28_05310, partial [Actinomycetota bacterium]
TYAGERLNEGDVRFRLVATKGDKRVAKTFRVGLGKRALAWIEKRAAAGWNVVVRKEKEPH